MEKAGSSMNASHSSINKMNKKVLKKQISKMDKLVQLYKELRSAIKKLEEREISFGEDYDEQFEDACDRRLVKLAQKRLRIHKYLVRKGIFVSDTDEAIFSKPKLIITSTGNEDLNGLLTEYVNQETESEILGSKMRLLYRHVTVEDVKKLIDKLKETSNAQLFQDNPLEFDQLVQNIACEVNKLVKRFIEDYHRVGLDDWTSPDQASECGDFPSTLVDIDATDGKKEDSLSVPTWDIANMELHEACGRGELDCLEPENSGDIDDTAMSPTADEVENGEGCEDDIEDSVAEDIENNNSESDDSCCIIEERMYGRNERNDDSDCCVVENNGTKISEGTFSEDIENMDAYSVDNMENPSKDEKEEMESDRKIVNDDDDCYIIED